MARKVRTEFAPMLAASGGLTAEGLAELDYSNGYIVQPKYDGIRCVTLPVPPGLDPAIKSQPFSRTLKRIPNQFVCAGISDLPPCLDGELMVMVERSVADAKGNTTTFGAYDDVESGVMSRDEEPDFRFVVYDTFREPLLPYNQRIGTVQKALLASPHSRVIIAPSELCTTPAEVETCYQTLLEAGYEGAILRDPVSPYKYGRSTEREGILLKYKPLLTSEAEILEVLPLLKNMNEAKKDALGRTERSSHKANKVAMPMVGSFRVRDIHDGREFSLGSGPMLTKLTRTQLWEARDTLPGKILHYECNPGSGHVLPRNPRVKGFRSPSDL